LVLLQIWDSQDGTIVWEGAEEPRIATETVRESPVTLTRIMGTAAEDLIEKPP
jgi:hypothetical protein